MTKRPTTADALQAKWDADPLDLQKVDDLVAFFAKRKADPLFGVPVPEGYVEDDADAPGESAPPTAEDKK